LVSQPDTRIWGLSGSKITNVNRSGSTGVLKVAAPNVFITGLELTQDDPLNDPGGILTAGINISEDAGVDTSGLWIDRCHIHGVRTCIQRSGFAGSEVGHRVRLTNNFLHSFSHSGIYIAHNTQGCWIFNNDIQGRLDGETHGVIGNGIYTAEFSHDLTVERNIIQRVDVNGIEHYSLPGGIGSNRNGQFLHNRVFDVGGIGISIFGSDSTTTIGNQVKGAVLGIEVYNNDSTLGENIVALNFIKDIGFTPGSTSPSVGISINQVIRAIVYGNTIENVRSDTGIQSIGMQLFNGCIETVIEGNKFRDAGNAMLWVNGDGVDVFNRLVIRGNSFFFTGAFAATYADQSFWPAIRVANATAVVTDNTSFYPTGTPYGRMYVTDNGIAYAGNEFEAPVSSANNGSYIRGSNRVIAY
jgi:hypothetical protein